MDPNVRAERFDQARKRLQAVAETLADKSGDNSIQEKALRIDEPISGAIEPQTRDLLKLEATVETLEAAVMKFSGSVPEESQAYDFSPIVGNDGNEALHAAGYTKPADVNEASDEDLLAVDGIGQKKLADLRASGL